MGGSSIHIGTYPEGLIIIGQASICISEAGFATEKVYKRKRKVTLILLLHNIFIH